MTRYIFLALTFYCFGIQAINAQISPNNCPDTSNYCIDATPGSNWFWRDVDGDGIGGMTGQCLVATTPPAGYSNTCNDCNDSNSGVGTPSAWYADTDNDGYGGNTVTYSCTRPSGYVGNSDDCNDNDPNIGLALRWYRDLDGDGYGNPNSFTNACNQPSGYVSNNDDCNDNDPNNQVLTFYKDNDSDGYGDPNIFITACTPLLGYVSNNNDCDDNNSFINPATRWYPDADGDGYGNYSLDYITQCEPVAGRAAGPPDCNDANAGINPATIWYLDSDNDGIGDSEDEYLVQCAQPSGYVLEVGGLEGVPEEALPSLSGLNINDLNYTHTIEPLKEVTTLDALANLSNSDKIETKVYHDGLGREVQQIAMRQGGYHKDVVTYIEYDRFGRTVKSYAPFGRATGISGTFVINPKEQLEDFYSTASVSNSYAKSTNPYSESVYDRSPRNRMERQGSSGESWKIGNGHEKEYDYALNKANSVRRFSVELDEDFNPTLVSEGYYDANQLAVTISKDENWTGGVNHTTKEYKNKDGLVIVKRGYVDGITLSTYYVYDEYNNLTYVLPPKAEPDSNTITSNVLNTLCYQHKYDGLRREVSKRIPGVSGWEKVVYDREDRIALIQDTNLSLENKWIFTKYDQFGRVLYTGIFTSTQTQEELQNLMENMSSGVSNNEVRGTATINGVVIGYSNQSFPNTNIELLTVNYYDDYTFLDTDTPATPFQILGQPVTSNTKGLLTGAWSRTISSSSWTKSYSFYDERARVLRGYNINHLGGHSYIDTEYDFRGKPLQSITNHKRISSDTPIVITDRFIYDQAERVHTQHQKINTHPEKILNGHIYDGIGQLLVKYIEPQTEIFGFEMINRNQSRSDRKSTGTALDSWKMDKESNGRVTTTRNGLKVDMRTQGDVLSGDYKLIGRNEYAISFNIDISNFDPDLLFKVSKEGVTIHQEQILRSGKFTAFLSPLESGTYRFELIMGSINNLETSQYFIFDSALLEQGLSADSQTRDLVSIEALQQIDYKYNSRGSLTAINEVKNLGDDVFAYRMNYDIGFFGAYSEYRPQYNGNVSRIYWATKNDHVIRDYKYAYDHLNRLTKADFSDYNYDLNNITYDKNGNILSLSRNLHNGGYQHLNYQYDEGNKLISNTGLTSYNDYLDNSAYTYDANGNMISNTHKGIGSITYNYLNLPEQVIFTSGTTIEYDYDASGNKLRKRYITTTGTTTTDYLGRFQYVNSTLKFFGQPEGYVRYNTITSENQYIYNYTDHLGNIRASYSDLDGNGSIASSEILKENNYYPFGMLHKGYNNTIHPDANSFTYGYGGKEHQEEAGIAWIDFGSRNYEAELGRWFNLDPQAERYNGISPYAAMANNPIFFSDPNGEELFTAVIIGAIAGAAIGATTVAIANPKATFGDILKGGIIGAFSGAVTAGIGSAGLGPLYAAGAHGVFQGALSAVQGGDFWQAAVIATASSSIASGVGNAGQAAIATGTRTATEVAVAQALSGAFVGGFSSQISGGSFIEGFTTGLTVAALNHSLHAILEPSVNQDWQLTDRGIQATRIAENYGGDAFEYYEFLEKHPFTLTDDGEGNHYVEIRGFSKGINRELFRELYKGNPKSTFDAEGRLIDKGAREGGKFILKHFFKKAAGFWLSDGSLANNDTLPLTDQMISFATHNLEYKFFSKKNALGKSWYDILVKGRD